MSKWEELFKSGVQLEYRHVESYCKYLKVEEDHVFTNYYEYRIANNT